MKTTSNLTPPSRSVFSADYLGTQNNMAAKKISLGRRIYIFIMKLLMKISVFFTCALVFFLIIYVLYKGLPHVTWELISKKPSYLTGQIGILPDI